MVVVTGSVVSGLLMLALGLFLVVVIWRFIRNVTVPIIYKIFGYRKYRDFIEILQKGIIMFNESIEKETLQLKFSGWKNTIYTIDMDICTQLRTQGGYREYALMKFSDFVWEVMVGSINFSRIDFHESLGTGRVIFLTVLRKSGCRRSFNDETLQEELIERIRRTIGFFQAEIERMQKVLDKKQKK